MPSATRLYISRTRMEQEKILLRDAADAAAPLLRKRKAEYEGQEIKKSRRERSG